jgi:putative spermidine/putrescine transport system ATP-binding protein
VQSVSGDQCALLLPSKEVLTGVNVNSAQVGQAAVACIRPERIRLAPFDSASNNRLRATIAGLIYFGDHVRVRCAVANQEECFVKVELNDSALPALVEGAQVALDLDKERLRIFI